MAERKYKMKALVVEIRGGKAAVLREDGIVVLIKKGNLAVGDTVNLDTGAARRNRRKIWRSVTAAAAAVAVVSVGGIYQYSAVQACSYVSVDLGSSLEYVLNRQNRVLTVEAVNENAEEFVTELRQEVKNKSLSEALEAAADLLEQQNLLTEEEDYILINVTSESEERTALLTELAESFFAESEDVTLVVTEATMDERRTARDLGISTGKYKEMETIEIQNNGSFAPDRAMTDSYRDMPVKEFMRMAGQIPEEPGAAGTLTGAPAGQTAPGQPGGQGQAAGGRQQSGQGNAPAAGQSSAAGTGQPAMGDQPYGQSQMEGGSQPSSQGYGAPADKNSTAGTEQQTAGNQSAGHSQPSAQGNAPTAGQNSAAGTGQTAPGQSTGQGQAAGERQPSDQGRTGGTASIGQGRISEQAPADGQAPSTGLGSTADTGADAGQNQTAGGTASTGPDQTAGVIAATGPGQAAGRNQPSGQPDQGLSSPAQNQAPAYQNQASAGPQNGPEMGR